MRQQQKKTKSDFIIELIIWLLLMPLFAVAIDIAIDKWIEEDDARVAHFQQELQQAREQSK